MTIDTPVSLSETPGEKSKRVFIVHGRNGYIVEAVATMVRSIGLEALDFVGINQNETT